jgi:hypothetical protein
VVPVVLNSWAPEQSGEDVTEVVEANELAGCHLDLKNVIVYSTLLNMKQGVEVVLRMK